jgi:hypothetical protein
MSPFFGVEQQLSDTPDAVLWSITAPVKAASGQEPGLFTQNLGRATDFSRWFAETRIWAPWLAPRQGKDVFQPDKDAILSAFERKDGFHLVLLAVSGIADVLTVFRHDGDGRVVIHSQNDRGQEGTVQVIAAVGTTLENAVAASMYFARRIVTRYEQAIGQADAEYQAMVDGFKPQWLENWCKSSVSLSTQLVRPTDF